MTEQVRLEKPWGNGRIVWERDATANDSDKSFTVPDGKVWHLLAVMAQITCTATAGNRNLVLSITNGTDRVWSFSTTASVAANQVGMFHIGRNLAEGTTNLLRITGDTTANVSRQTTMPDQLYLPAGYVVRVYDAAAVDAAADDMVTVLHYIEYDA